MKNSRGSKKTQYACRRNQISTFSDIWSSNSISFLSEDLFGNRCSSSGWAAGEWKSTQSPLCNIWFTWTIISACQMTDPKVTDVAVSNQGHEKNRKKHVLKIRWMSKIASFLRTDTCQRSHFGPSAIAGLSQNRISSFLHFDILLSLFLLKP